MVERPSSVIKELVENSIDAGSTSITVEIKNGGIKYMRITDNGCGILHDDVPKAFLRHATSKVRQQDDLDAIATLGFRGEALASICAVSKVELLTCGDNEAIGSRYTVSGGEEGELEEAGCPKGTTIIVRDLFYNIPARMKFLKKDISEGNAVAGVMDKIALSHPEISITFIRDGKQALKTPGDSNLKSAIYSVYGREFAQGLITVDYKLNGISVTGFISKPQNSRKNRNMQSFFINGRFVKSRTAMAALEEAYKGSVMTGKFPACVLHISLSCEVVDVNVHPAKIEVRFINERPVFDAVYHSVKTALLNGDTVKKISLNPADIIPHKRPNPFDVNKNPYAVKEENPTQLMLKTNINDYAGLNEKKQHKVCDEPELFIPKKHKFSYTPVVADNEETDNKVTDSFKVNTVDFFDEKKTKAEPYANGTDKSETSETYVSVTENSVFQGEHNSGLPTENSDFPNNVKPVNIHIAQDNGNEPEEKHSVRYIGEAFKTYIIVQRGDNEILLIDKHAAHERIIYEKLKKEKGAGYMQYLIAPVSVTLSKQEYDILLDNREQLLDAGFEIDDFGNGTVLVRGIPQYIDHEDIKSTIEEIAGGFLSHRHSISTEQMDWVYHSVSCRAAIKAGNINHEIELMEIADILENDENIRYCPHGRPVSVVLTKREIEKQFGRV